MEEITQEQLDNLAEWLQSDEGRKTIIESQKRAEKEIAELFKIDPKKLREPFDYVG